MMVCPVNQRHIGLAVGQGLQTAQTGEAATGDHNMGSDFAHLG